MSAIEVILTYGEMRIAIEVAAQRQCANIKGGLKDGKHFPEDDIGWNAHIEGACGEMAVAKYFDRFWSGAIGDFRADDVGKFQVRTRSKFHYELMLHRTDSDDKPFILVTGRAPSLHLVGWIVAKDGKREEFWSDPAGGRPAFFVPHRVLHPMGTLKEVFP